MAESNNAEQSFLRACIGQMLEDGAKPPNFVALQQKLSDQYSHAGSLSNKWYAFVKKLQDPQTGKAIVVPKSPRKRKEAGAPKSPRKKVVKKDTVLTAEQETELNQESGTRQGRAEEDEHKVQDETEYVSYD